MKKSIRLLAAGILASTESNAVQVESETELASLFSSINHEHGPHYSAYDSGAWSSGGYGGYGSFGYYNPFAQGVALFLKDDVEMFAVGIFADYEAMALTEIQTSLDLTEFALE